MEWSDRQGSRDRQAWLLLVSPDGVVRVFAGESIPGIVAVVGSDYEKAGKWSHTTFRLELAPGVRAVPGRDGWETGTLREALGADRWVDAANVLSVSVAQVQAFVRAWRPKAAEHWDRVEAELEAVDAEAPDEGATTATLSFGSPTNRVAREGFWDWPVRVLDAAGCEVGRIIPGPGSLEGETSWASPVSSGTVRVLDHDRSAGYHGGTVSLRCAIPDGCRLEHGPAPATPPEPAVTPGPEAPLSPASIEGLRARFGGRR